MCEEIVKTCRGCQINDSFTRNMSLFVVIPNFHVDNMDGFVEVTSPGKQIWEDSTSMVHGEMET